MRHLLSLSTSILVLTMCVAAADAQTTTPYKDSAPPPGTPVSPLPAPDASTQRGQGAVNQPLAPPPSPSQYNQTQTDSGKQSGSTVPGSPVSPVPAPDASTAQGQDSRNSDMAVGRHKGGGITEQK